MDFIDVEEKEDDFQNFGFAEMKDDDENIFGDDESSSEGPLDGDDKKRRDLSLRMAVELNDTPSMRVGFAIVVLTTLAMLFLYQVGKTFD
jgi:hypothetical protein